MPRLVLKKDNQPLEVKKGVWVCMCGLSQTQPFCDASHKRTEAEGEDVYFYGESDRRKVDEIKVAGHTCRCSGANDCSGCTQK